MASIVSALFFVSAAGAAPTFTVDGIYDPGNDAYSHQFVVPLKLDNGTLVGSTTIKVGIGANADGVTGGSSDLFVYADLPLTLKDMTWGTGTHSGYAESSNDVEGGIIAMNQNTGSEKIFFEFNGQEGEIKLSQRGNSDMQACSDAGTCVGHELRRDAGGAIVSAATSLDFIMQNFPNNPGELNLWGDDNKDGGSDVSNSPGIDSDYNLLPGVDPMFADWPFKQSWEFQIAGNFSASDLPNLLTSTSFFGGELFTFHASPIKDGDKFDIVPNCDPCTFEEIPTQTAEVSEPGTLVIVSFALMALAYSRKKFLR